MILVHKVVGSSPTTGVKGDIMKDKIQELNKFYSQLQSLKEELIERALYEEASECMALQITVNQLIDIELETLGDLLLREAQQ
jgi:hypothetical protein